MGTSTRISNGLPKVNGLERPCLVEIYGPNLGRTVLVDAPVTMIGRSPECDLVVELDNVSRQHCTIQVRAGGVFVLDRRSTNGTFVNDEALEGERSLCAGDLLRVGSAVFKFLSAGHTGDLEAQYHETIHRLAITDGLTQLYNKRYLLEFLEREMARAIRHRRPVSILLLDVDHFKQVNDKHGHIGGDFVLRELATILRARTRREECLARYGGEELCFVFPEATRDDAFRRGDELRRICEDHAFVYDGTRIPVTFSGGVAQRVIQEMPVELLKAADERLYEAKRSGRNRVC
jgi:two-component system, cell cycle response regulator